MYESLFPPFFLSPNFKLVDRDKNGKGGGIWIWKGRVIDL